MRQITVRFPIVVYPSEFDDIGRFTAHCLNMDLIADDDTVEGAILKLLETIEVQLDAAEVHAAYPMRSAPEEYWEKLSGAQALAAELLERIVQTANKRNGVSGRPIDVGRQCDLRQVAMACA